MSKQVLSIEQMQHLKELGVDTSKAKMCWIIDEEKKYKPFVSLSIDASDHVDYTTYALPTFTLQEILNLLPISIKRDNERYYINIGKYASVKDTWYIRYSHDCKELLYIARYDLINAAYEMLCLVVKNGYLETNK